ncbi:hypothetical protein BT93_H2133 [Corymbia citriodora subsp. variegata]|nr:hypothetical protein BT93_H2133 [Corymbia citriodora subsp. variegata]
MKNVIESVNDEHASRNYRLILSAPSLSPSIDRPCHLRSVTAAVKSPSPATATSAVTEQSMDGHHHRSKLLSCSFSLAWCARES